MSKHNKQRTSSGPKTLSKVEGLYFKVMHKFYIHNIKSTLLFKSLEPSLISLCFMRKMGNTCSNQKCASIPENRVYEAKTEF